LNETGQMTENARGFEAIKQEDAHG
jgi:hypothetical protein